MQHFISNVYDGTIQIQTPYVRCVGHEDGYVLFRNENVEFLTFIENFSYELKQKYNVNVPILENGLLKIHGTSCHRFVKRMETGDAARFTLNIDNCYEFENENNELPCLSKILLTSLRPLPTSSLLVKSPS